MTVEPFAEGILQMWLPILTISALNGAFFTALSIWNAHSLWVCMASYVLASLCGMLLMMLMGLSARPQAEAEPV